MNYPGKKIMLALNVICSRGKKNLEEYLEGK